MISPRAEREQNLPIAGCDGLSRGESEGIGSCTSGAFCAADHSADLLRPFRPCRPEGHPPSVSIDLHLVNSLLRRVLALHRSSNTVIASRSQRDYNPYPSTGQPERGRRKSRFCVVYLASGDCRSRRTRCNGMHLNRSGTACSGDMWSRIVGLPVAQHLKLRRSSLGPAYFVVEECDPGD